MEVVCLGKEWKFKKALYEEILKEIDYNSLTFLESLNNFKPNEKTLIITNRKNFNFLKEQFSKKIVKSEKDSFLIEFFYPVNIILLEDKIPEILINSPLYEEVNIFNFEVDEVKKRLNPIFKNYELKPVIFEEAKIVKLYLKKLNNKLKNEILNKFNSVVFGNLFSHIVNNLPPKKITFAESCTGGLIASTLTKIPGSSKCFDGSMVTYANRIKNEWLGVKNSTLEKYGAVSKETVKEMLTGILKKSSSDYAVAVSGIAGPSGGTPLKPVGTVYIGVADKNDLKIELLHLKGDRNYIQYLSMMNAIRLFITFSRLYSKGI